ncbi:dioxygenase family protein [Qaidamihabitans albus]|uniref:dioxygenase family protein n=1 Tax=Qaidamihabitans albus TaxID=2795733 RepID=UPI0018F2367D|nr:class III extradiol ring-cleavage dioxygenase [Qaidamihabitans albus]
MVATADRMPVLYLSHGAPPLADDPTWTRQLAEWSAGLRRPTAILVVSAHWEEAPLTIGATTTVPLVYDFWGFPEHYYQVRYPAPGAPELAATVRGLLRGGRAPVRDAPDRGLDHGAYVPLVEMFPDADIPVLQISMPSLDPRELFALGRRLAPLRDEGVLIVGSGFFTHNLQVLQSVGDSAGAPPAWSAEFDLWGEQVLGSGDIDALLDFERKAPAARLAHPRIEHFAPLFVSLGAGEASGPPRTAIDGYWFGLAKRSVQLG